MRGLALLVIATGCHYGGTFMCDRSEQCGVGGSCQATHYCSFTDMACTSGQRYDETAGAYGGVCVGEENGVDAAVFNPATCPVTYTITIPSSPKSAYYVRTATSSFWMHHSACKGDLAGATHLLLPDSAAELSEIIAATATMAVGEDEFFVGAAQNVAAAIAPDAGWTRVDGNALDPALWQPGDPSDSDGSEANHNENVAAVARATKLLEDEPGTAIQSPAICECDGKAVPTVVESILASDPNHD